MGSLQTAAAEKHACIVHVCSNSVLVGDCTCHKSSGCFEEFNVVQLTPSTEPVFQLQARVDVGVCEHAVHRVRPRRVARSCDPRWPGPHEGHAHQRRRRRPLRPSEAPSATRPWGFQALSTQDRGFVSFSCTAFFENAMASQPNPKIAHRSTTTQHPHSHTPPPPTSPIPPSPSLPPRIPTPLVARPGASHTPSPACTHWELQHTVVVHLVDVDVNDHDLHDLHFLRRRSPTPAPRPPAPRPAPRPPACRPPRRVPRRFNDDVFYWIVLSVYSKGHRRGCVAAWQANQRLASDSAAPPPAGC